VGRHDVPTRGAEAFDSLGCVSMLTIYSIVWACDVDRERFARPCDDARKWAPAGDRGRCNVTVRTGKTRDKPDP